MRISLHLMRDLIGHPGGVEKPRVASSLDLSDDLPQPVCSVRANAVFTELSFPNTPPSHLIG